MTLGTELLAKSATPATATPVCDTSGRSVKAADSTRADVTDDKTCPTPAGMTSPSPRPAISFKAQQFANAPRAGPRNCPEGPCSRTCPRGEIRANRRARRPVATGMSARRVDTMFSSPDGSATVISINFVHGRRSRPPGARSSLLHFFSSSLPVRLIPRAVAGRSISSDTMVHVWDGRWVPRVDGGADAPLNRNV